MKSCAIVLLVAMLAACANTKQEEGIVAKNDAIEDYVVAAELEGVDKIRTRQQVRHKVLTDRYIIISDSRNSYLATFNRRCYELDDRHVTPDVRYEKNTIRARFDTYRGCRIETLYELTDGQAQELIDLGERADQ